MNFIVCIDICGDFNVKGFGFFFMIMFMIVVVRIFNNFIFVRICRVGLLYCKEILVYLYLVVVMIGWVCFW